MSKAKAAGLPGDELKKIFKSEVRSLIGVIAVVSTLVNLLHFALPLYMLSVFDRVVPTKGIETFIALTLMVALAFAVQSLLMWLRSRIFVRLATRFDIRLSEKVFRSVLLISCRERADIGGAGHQPVATLRNFLTTDAIFVVFDVPMALLVLVFFYFIHPVLAAVYMAGMCLVLFFGIMNEVATAGPLKKSMALSQRAANQANMAVMNSSVVEAMGMRNAIVRRWAKINNESLIHSADASDRGGLWTNLTLIVKNGMAVGMMAAGIILILSNSVATGAAFAALLLVGRGLGPIAQAIGSWRQYVMAREAYGQIQEILNGAPTEQERLELPPPKGALSVEGVFYMPPGTNRQVLRGVGFQLPPGSGLGIIGHSAAGKSTLVQVILGVIPPSAGKVRLDGADLTEWDKERVGRYIGYVPQDVQLFDGTVADNIARFQDGPHETIVEAAKLAGVHDMVLRLPNGYETLIGARGALLSAGQRQRIALARALYGNPRLIVLDEPNSNLDAEGEKALLDAIQAAKAGGATVIMVTHRPSTLAFADRILVLRDGMVEKFADREAVLKDFTVVRGRPGQPPAEVAHG